MDIIICDKELLTISYVFNNSESFSKYINRNYVIHEQIDFDSKIKEMYKYENLKEFISGTMKFEKINVINGDYEILLKKIEEKIMEQCILRKHYFENELKDQIIELEIFFQSISKNDYKYNILLNPLERINIAFGFKSNSELFCMINPNLKEFEVNLVSIIHEYFHFILRDYYKELTITKLIYSDILNEIGISNYIKSIYMDLNLIVEEILVTILSIKCFQRIYKENIEYIKNYRNEQAHHFGENAFNIMEELIEKSIGEDFNIQNILENLISYGKNFDIKCL